MIDAAGLCAGDEVLEVGCGWGAFAIRAAQRTGCRVTGLTLSKEQLAEASARVAAAGLGGRVTLLFCDYRDVPGAGSWLMNGHRRVSSLQVAGVVGLSHRYQHRQVPKDQHVAAKPCPALDVLKHAWCRHLNHGHAFRCDATCMQRLHHLGAVRSLYLLCVFCAAGEARFDKVVSIEMIEAVGHENLPAYFGTIGRLLKPGGRAVLQAICCPDDRCGTAAVQSVLCAWEIM